MTHPTQPPETPASLLAPLARGLLRRAPAVLAVSVHDTGGGALWTSEDFMREEDHALILAVLADPHDVRGRSDGLWWESVDAARARCALAIHEGEHFRGVLLVVFSSVTTGDDDRASRIAELAPTLPVLAKALRIVAGGVPTQAALAALPAEAYDQIPMSESTGETSVLEVLRLDRFDPPSPLGDDAVDDMLALAREEHLLGLIDHALRDDEFALHLQPIVSLRDDSAPLIVEVLIRLPTREFGVLASHEFLETAERNGRMPKIDRWVVRALLVWMQRNRDRWEESKVVFSVNLSGKSVVRPDFRDYLASCLDKSGLPYGAFRFEVAELDAGLAPQEFALLARSLIDRGCEVSVDNAGAGSGRYDFLREVNADILKIDGTLVQGASDDIVSRALINGLVHMADTLGMRTVASQVDTTSKLRAVTQLGVDYVQGFRVQHPAHIDAFEFLACGAQRAPVHV
jgi:EAL domain-containing protein (putative c-di-GMP-specific phosphodiesterase class I)